MLLCKAWAENCLRRAAVVRGDSNKQVFLVDWKECSLELYDAVLEW